MTPPIRLDALVDHVGRARHDLGRYVCFSARWLGGDAPDEDLRTALREDLAATRKQGSTVLSAPALWSALRPLLVAPAALPDGGVLELAADAAIQRVDDAIRAIEEGLPALDAAPRSALEALRRAALEVAEALNDLYRRVRLGADGGGPLPGSMEGRWPASS